MIKSSFSIMLLSIFMAGCQLPVANKEQQPTPAENQRLYQQGATLWYQHSGEMRAAYYQGYRLATLNLQAYLNKPTSEKPPCVVVDVDETVLNNSPHQAWTILNNKTFPEGWLDWTLKAEAKALPGSLEFLTYAAQNGVEVFYITNRSVAEKQATIKNLSNLNFPFADSLHVMVKTETSSKVERRQAVSQNFEIVLLVGDNLGDFEDFYRLNLVERNQKVEDLKSLFGVRFIVLPNPMYGDWEGAFYEYNYSQPDSVLKNIRMNTLVGF